MDDGLLSPNRLQGTKTARPASTGGRGRFLNRLRGGGQGEKSPGAAAELELDFSDPFSGQHREWISLITLSRNRRPSLESGWLSPVGREIVTSATGTNVQVRSCVSFYYGPPTEGTPTDRDFPKRKIGAV